MSHYYRFTFLALKRQNTQQVNMLNRFFAGKDLKSIFNGDSELNFRQTLQSLRLWKNEYAHNSQIKDVAHQSVLVVIKNNRKSQEDFQNQTDKLLDNENTFNECLKTNNSICGLEMKSFHPNPNQITNEFKFEPYEMEHLIRHHLRECVAQSALKFNQLLSNKQDDTLFNEWWYIHSQRKGLATDLLRYHFVEYSIDIQIPDELDVEQAIADIQTQIIPSLYQTNEKARAKAKAEAKLIDYIDVFISEGEAQSQPKTQYTMSWLNNIMEQNIAFDDAYLDINYRDDDTTDFLNLCQNTLMPMSPISESEALARLTIAHEMQTIINGKKM